MISRINHAKSISKALNISEIAGWDRWNSFTETIIGFDLPSQQDEIVEFSRENVAAFSATIPGDYYYPIGQVFEPDVVREVCDLHGLDYEDVTMLRTHGGERVSELQERLDRVESMDDPDVVVLASALVTLSRFELASSVLTRAGDRGVRFQFEAALLRYIIGNRTQGRGLDVNLMSEVRRTAASQDVPAHRLLDACSIAVVWYLKGVGVTKEDFEWFARTGNTVVLEHGKKIPAVSTSAWYRGVAMIPAEIGDVSRTRALMNEAAVSAQRAMEDSDAPFARNLHKTYLESSVKEHLYVSRDEEKAIQAAKDLVAWDPLWSVSAGEYADVLAAFGKSELAAETYDRATSLGAPYVTHHLRKAAQQYAKAGMTHRAIARYLVLASMLPDPTEVLATVDNMLDNNTHATLMAVRQQLAAS
ncbi:hypothetical protein [Arthrobacter sp. Rue61a]|uniref:tetratricopeptide repeat protein n=1 Tax=Arthrobacter sp. Rue61a TaxID=1118963 RepID=UPI00027DF476|nr:hypothetical protein [Arthrobacter sp. Rue61a]AFR30790.1 hypothetical protein ARUE_c39180 [Arthrobacter sp. Rue61a]